MSPFMPRLFVPAAVMILTVGAFAISDDAQKPGDAKGDDRPGGAMPATEVVMIETKIGSTFSVAQTQTRVIAGQSFIGGNSMTETGELDGNRIWVPVGDVSRMTEYETVARFLMKDKIDSAMKHRRQLQQHLKAIPAGSEKVERIKREIKSLDDLISGKKTDSKSAADDDIQ